MTAELSSIVSVSITSDSKTVSRQGFGTPLVLSYHARFVDAYRAYSSLSEMVEDGFAVYDEAYLMAAAIFAQDPCPEQVIVGRLTSAPAYTSRVQMLSATEGHTISLKYREPQSGTAVSVSRTVPAASSLGAEATAVAALVNDVDVDSIKTNGASTAGIQSLVAADFDGAIGDDAFTYPRRVTITLNSHADWDATTIVVAGKDANGATYSEDFTVPNGGNATLTSAGLYTKVTAITVPAQSGTNGTFTVGTRAGAVGTVAATSYIDFTPLTAGRKVHVYDLVNASIEETTADAAYDTALSALQLENDDWYFVCCDSSSPANVADIAAWTLTAKKLYFFDSNSALALAGTPAVDLSSNTRSVGLFSRNSHEYNALRWVGVGASNDPGTITWAFKQLAGATDHALSTTQKNFLEGDDLNHHQTVAGLSITRQGVTTSGEYIDVQHGIDALEADIKESVFAAIASLPKVPFTERGLSVIESAIKGALLRFSGQGDTPGLIAAGTATVIMPALSSISTADKAARRLRNVRFSGTLEGAIHSVTIAGTLSV